MGKVENGEQLTAEVNASIEELQCQMAEGHSAAYLESLNWFAKLHRYSWGNTLLISTQCPHATIVAGYKRWQELGFQVRQGEAGIAIRAPWLRKHVDETTGEITQRLIGYIGTYVWDISQTAEYPDKQPPELFQEVPGDYDELYRHLCDRVRGKNLQLEERQLQLGMHGFYQNGLIVINSNLTPYLKATCLVHEYIHSIAHFSPLHLAFTTKDEREWQAESVCYVVCKAIGVENVNSRDYLLSYRMTTDKLGEMIKLIQRLTKQVLEDLNLLQPVTEHQPADTKDTLALAAD